MQVLRESNLYWRLLKPGLKTWWQREGFVLGLLFLALSFGSAYWGWQVMGQRLSSATSGHGFRITGYLDLYYLVGGSVLPAMRQFILALAWFLLLGRMGQALRVVSDSHAAPVAILRAAPAFLVCCRAVLPLVFLRIVDSLLVTTSTTQMSFEETIRSIETALQLGTMLTLEFLLFAILIIALRQQRWSIPLFVVAYAIPTALWIVGSWLSRSGFGAGGVTVYSLRGEPQSVGLLLSLALIFSIAAAAALNLQWIRTGLFGILCAGLLFGRVWFALPSQDAGWHQVELPLRNTLTYVAQLEAVFNWLPFSVSISMLPIGRSDEWLATYTLDRFSPFDAGHYPVGVIWLILTPLLNLMYVALLLGLLVSLLQWMQREPRESRNLAESPTAP